MGHGYRPLISKIRCENPNKKGTKVKNYNLLRYIATREGVDLTRINSMDDFVNQNVDLTDAGEDKIYEQSDNDVYLKYIAHRPRSHGLFGNIDTEKFESVSKALNKASDEKKVIYRGVISLSELDGQALGYNNAEKWNSYLKSVMPDIAETLGLSPNNMTWVAAFHAEQNHPHVHYVLWDNRDIVKSPFIKVSQQKQCREICQNAMFTAENEAVIREITAKEREEYYSIQNDARKNITDYMQDIFSGKEFIPGLDIEKLPGRMREETHKELNELYKKVLSTMPGKGRIAYKYMPVECKAYIDRITDIFLKEPDIKEEYHKYITSIKEIHKSLGKTKEESTKAQNDAIKELQSRTGNIVLQGICSIKADLLTNQVENHINTVNDVKEPDIQDYEFEKEPVDGVESDITEKKELIQSIRPLLDKNGELYNPIEAEQILLDRIETAAPELKNYICKKLGELYADSNSVLEDYDKALYYLKDQIGDEVKDSNVHSILGKIYSDKKLSGYDIKAAETHYLQAIKDPKKNYIKLKLSRLYADKESELLDYDKALDILANYTDKKGSVSLQKGNIYVNEDCPFYDMEDAKYNYENAVLKGNAFAAYQLGKIYIEEGNLSEGIKYLEKAAEGEVVPAQLKLGNTYMNPNLEFYDVNKAHRHLTDALDNLKKIEEKPYSKLSRGEQQSKAQACYYLGKVYAEGIGLPDYSLAMEHYKLCIESYEKVGEVNNSIINSTYLKMAQLCMNAEECCYRPKLAEEYLKTAFLNTLELEHHQEHSPGENYNKILRQTIRLRLCNLYMDESTHLGNLDKAMRAVEFESDESGYFALKRGDIYANEKYSGYDMNKAISSYKEAAEAYNSSAMVKLAKCYMYGIGVERDKEVAASWLNRAVAQGDKYAMELKKDMDSVKFNGYTYAILRQLFSSMAQSKNKSQQHLREAEFKNNSKQVKKEEYMHHN